MRERPIPNYVDEQMQIFFWEVDEFIPTLAIFVIFYTWDQVFFGILLSYVFVKVLSRFKSAHMSGVIFHACWWVGLIKMNPKFENGLVREYVR